MKKLVKLLVALVFGIFLGYYICDNKLFSFFKSNYKAFQVGVYTSLDAANTYKTKYNNSVVIKDNELYRVYVAILKEESNIESMSNYLSGKGIEYYLKDLSINDKILKKELRDYENIMDTNNEVVFLEVNKMIMQKYKESL